MAESISDHAGTEFKSNQDERNCLEEKAQGSSADDSHRTPMHSASRTECNDASAPWRRGEFYKSLSSEAMSQFESAGTPFCTPENAVLFAEEQQPCFVLFLLEGRVKLSMNSIGGRRLILGLSRPGDILGLTSAISGLPYEMTAEAQYPCRLRSFPRQIFLDFVLRNPVASQNVARELSLE
jgi:CRP/FNR family transcriptional regulator